MGDDLEQFQELAKRYPGESQFFAQLSSRSSGEDHITSDMEALYYDIPKDKSGSSSDGSSSGKKSKLQKNKSGSPSDSSSSVKSSNSRKNKKSKVPEILSHSSHR